MEKKNRIKKLRYVVNNHGSLCAHKIPTTKNDISTMCVSSKTNKQKQKTQTKNKQ
jgi:hypothetical protein